MKPKLVRKQEPSYFLRDSHETPEQGPFLLEELREMANAGSISLETLVRREKESSYRPFSADPPLAAELWPDEEPFDPAALDVAAKDGASAESAESGGSDDGFEAAAVLQENLERERIARATMPIEEEGLDWQSQLLLWFPFVRWGIALVLLGIILYLWLVSETSPAMALVWGMGLGLAILVLVGLDLARLASAPFNGLLTTLWEGSGGGGKADYWTADSLMQQGQYQLALSEYRKIALQHPRELQAYLQGIRAARALNNKREADRFYQMALDNLKSEQDRNLFIQSVERM